MLKTHFLAGLMLAVGASSAFAADPAPADWTGIYLGVHGGYGGGTFDYPMNIQTGDLSGTGTGPFDDLDYDFGADITSSGFFGGLQAGWNWQTDRILLGIEGDISKSNIESNLELYSVTADSSIEGGSTVDWYGTARLRAGLLVTPDLLVYGTGGLAWGAVDANYKLDIVGSTLTGSETTDHMGWAAGGGIEYAVTDNLSIKTEYLYVDLGKENVLDDEIFPDVNLKIDQDISFHTIQAGLNYRF